MRLKDAPWKLKDTHYQQQLAQIRELCFWEKLTQKPSGSAVWHFHPVAFIKQLKSLMGITKDQLRAIMPGITDENIDKYLLPLNETMEKYGINENRLRQCHFLAQVSAETGNLSFPMEKGNISESRNVKYENESRYYEDTTDSYFVPQYVGKNGNVKSKNNEAADEASKTDAVKFRGRGLLHVTGRANYAAYWLYREWISQKDFKAKWWEHGDNNPAMITDPQRIAVNASDACDAGGWYWKTGSNRGNANLLADEDGTDEVVKKITKLVNGGTNGLDERTKAFHRARTILVGG